MTKSSFSWGNYYVLGLQHKIEKLVAAKQILVAEQIGKFVGHLTFNYCHVDWDKVFKQDVILADDLAVKEEYPG